MDVHDLVKGSKVLAGVLGNGDEFLLVRLDKDYPSRQADIDCAIARGLFYCGVLSWDGSKMAAALEPDPDTLKPMRLATEGFGVLCGRIEAQESEAAKNAQGDSLAWLERLQGLTDPRD